jgi:2-succinyl-5-enolpyruvyl-6-hydroxy-3-cyclohexene-1-carboxylate synthase
MNNLNTFWAELMIEELIRCGVKYFFISPGSRSTPLTAAVAKKRKAHKIIVFDERSSGFMGVGYGQAKNEPAVIITTSGTAVANLFAAVVEANLSQIPLILLSADRPFESHGIGENQTINQINIFHQYAKFFYNMPCPDYKIAPEMVLSTIGYAHNLCMCDPMGVSHINCMFRKPLEPDTEEIEPSYCSSVKQWGQSKKKYTLYHKTTKTPDQDSMDKLADTYPQP